MDMNHPLIAMLIPRGNLARGILHATRAAIGSLPMVARALLTQSHKRIRIVTRHGAATGSTNCQSLINLPVLPIPSRESQVEEALVVVALAYGLIHHEIGHCNYTDAASMKGVRNSVEADLLNIIEDVRMENAHIQRLPAARAYLDALNWAMQMRGMWGEHEPGQDALTVFRTYTMAHLNGVYRRDPAMAKVLDAWAADFDAMFSSGIRLELDQLFTEVPTLTSAFDSLALARRVVGLMEQFAEPEPQDGVGDPTDPQANPDPSDASGAPQDPGSDQSNAPTPTAGPPSDTSAPPQNNGSGTDDPSSTGQADDCDTDGAGGSTGATSEGGDDDGQAVSASDTAAATAAAVAQVLNAEASADGSDKHQRAQALLEEAADGGKAGRQRLDVSASIDDLNSSTALGAKTGHSGTLMLGGSHALSTAHAVSLEIRRKLLAELDAVTNADLHVGRRGRSLSGRHLDRVMSGDSRVFQTLIEGRSPDTGIMLVEDVSGSTDGPVVALASVALYSTALALEGIEGIEVAAMVFPGNGKVMGFGQSPRRCRGNFQLTAHGGTPMAEAINTAAQALLLERFRRRCMVVLTDGEPDCEESTKAMIAAAESRGIEVYGVGICTDAVRKLFTSWTSINDVNELPERLVRLVRDQVMLSVAA